MTEKEGRVVSCSSSVALALVLSFRQERSDYFFSQKLVVVFSGYTLVFAFSLRRATSKQPRQKQEEEGRGRGGGDLPDSTFGEGRQSARFRCPPTEAPSSRTGRASTPRASLPRGRCEFFSLWAPDGAARSRRPAARCSRRSPPSKTQKNSAALCVGVYWWIDYMHAHLIWQPLLVLTLPPVGVSV